VHVYKLIILFIGKLTEPRKQNH